MEKTFVRPSLNVPDKLSREEMEALGVVDPWRFCLALGLDLAVVVGAIAFSEHFFFNALAYLVAVVLIGSRLHAMGILMHDCVHYRAFRSRKLNMLVGEFLGWSVVTTAEGYRNNHLTHHRHLNTMQDPDWARKVPQQGFHYPKSRTGLVQSLLFQLSGLGILQLFRTIQKSPEFNQVSRRIRLQRLAFYTVVVAVCALTGVLGKLALYWLVPMLTTFPLFFYIRSVGEHHGNLAYDHTYTNSRTTIPHAWERFLFMPHNVGFHLEHHLFPHVPFYRLPALHRTLMERREFVERAHVTHGVCTGLLGEWVAPARGPLLADFGIPVGEPFLAAAE